jgi:hypothetical protein
VFYKESLGKAYSKGIHIIVEKDLQKEELWWRQEHLSPWKERK